jgi:outer membrane biogenesis lipoprotein LolB
VKQLLLIVACLLTTGCATREAVTGTWFSAQRMPARIDRNQTAFFAIYVHSGNGPVFCVHAKGMNGTFGGGRFWIVRWWP